MDSSGNHNGICKAAACSQPLTYSLTKTDAYVWEHLYHLYAKFIMTQILGHHKKDKEK